MKRLIIIPILLLTSCAVKEMSKHKESCIVNEVSTFEKYSGLIPGRSYTIKTSCGYALTSLHPVAVGDTIYVDVYTYTKN